MTSKQNTGKITEWKKDNIDRIVIEARKSLQFPSRLKAAVDAGKAASRQDYIIRAVEKALIEDGISLSDTLPET